MAEIEADPWPAGNLLPEDDAERAVEDAIDAALNLGKPQLAEMIDVLDIEIQRRKGSVRAWTRARVPIDTAAWSRSYVVLDATLRLLKRIAQNEKEILAVLRPKTTPRR